MRQDFDRLLELNAAKEPPFADDERELLLSQVLLNLGASNGAMKADIFHDRALDRADEEALTHLIKEHFCKRLSVLFEVRSNGRRVHELKTRLSPPIDESSEDGDWIAAHHLRRHDHFD